MISIIDGTFRKWGRNNMTMGQFTWQKKKIFKKILFKKQ
jgi:calcineurin-like phosphoesterase